MLEVIALTPDDARAASDGGADRLELVGTMADDGLSPTPAVVSRVRAASAVPMRVMLRLRAGFVTDAREVARLVTLARAFVDAGADGLVLGFLDANGGLNRPMMDALLEATDLPWTFHRAIDHAADADGVWEQLSALPRLDQVLTAGSDAGVPSGRSRLLGWARGEHAASGLDRATLIMAGGGLEPEHVPVLAGAGITAFHIGGAARPARSFEATVDDRLVATWRGAVDAALAERYRGHRSPPLS